MKKLIAFLLVVFMTVFCFASCADENPENNDKTNTGITGSGNDPELPMLDIDDIIPE